MMNNKLRIVFMGTPDIVLPVFEALINSNHDIVCVYTQPPRPKGRGGKMQNTPVHDMANNHEIEVRTPLSLKKDEQARTAFETLDLDVAIVAGYGMMLPDAVLNAPKYGCLNVHPSLLPRWRGTSPVQSAVLHGDKDTGVSVMRLVQKMDAGPVIAQKTVPITSDITAVTLDAKLWHMGAEMLIAALDRYASGENVPLQKQDEDGVTYAPMLSREDGRIDWNKDAAEIDRQLRALNPWPGVWTMVNGKRLKIIEAKLSNEQSAEPVGTVLNKNGDIACGSGTALKLTTVQPENAKKMDFAAALNGGYLKVGDRLS